MTPDVQFLSGNAYEQFNAPVLGQGGTSAVQNLTATAVGVNEIDLSFQPPAFLNKAPILAYRVLVASTLNTDVSCEIAGRTVAFIAGIATCFTSVLMPTVTGLSTDQGYTFTVTPVNSRGLGLAATVTQTTLSVDNPWDPRVFFPAGTESVNVGPAIAQSSMTQVGTAGTNGTVLNVGIGGNVSSNITQQPRTDTISPTATTGATVLHDASIQANDVERVVIASNVPNGTYVSAVTPGASFSLVDISGNAVQITGSVSSIELGSHISGWDIDPQYATTVLSTTLSEAISVSSRTDTGVTAATSGGVTTITDAHVTLADLGTQVSGTNVPSGCYVGYVTAGTSFQLVDGNGNPVTASGVTSVTIGPATISQITLASLSTPLTAGEVLQVAESTTIGGVSTTVFQLYGVTANVSAGSDVAVQVGIPANAKINQANFNFTTAEGHATHETCGNSGQAIIPNYAYPIGATVTLSPELGYIQSTGATNSSLGPTGDGWGQGGGSPIVATMSDCYVAVNVIGNNGGIAFRRCTIRPSQATQVLFQQTVGNGGATTGCVLLDHSLIQGITDGSDPGMDFYAQYTLSQDQTPESIDGWLYAGGYPGAANAVQPNYVPPAYILANQQTLATRTPLENPITGEVVPYTASTNDSYQPNYFYQTGDLATMYPLTSSQGVDNHYGYECISPGVGDNQAQTPTSWVSGSSATGKPDAPSDIPYTSYGTLTASAFMPGYVAGGTINGVAESTTQQAELPQPFVISGGVAVGIDPSDIPTEYQNNAIWICTGGKPHCDGFQWSAASRGKIRFSYVMHCDNSCIFMQCHSTSVQPITGNRIEGNLLNGGANKWSLVQTIDGPSATDDVFNVTVTHTGCTNTSGTNLITDPSITSYLAPFAPITAVGAISGFFEVTGTGIPTSATAFIGTVSGTTFTLVNKNGVAINTTANVTQVKITPKYSGFPSGIYLSTAGTWELYTGSSVGDVRPRSVIYPQNWWGPLENGDTYPTTLNQIITDLSGSSITVGGNLYNDHLVFMGPGASNLTESQISSAWLACIINQYPAYTFSTQDQANIIAGTYDWNVFDTGPNAGGALISQSLMNTRLGIFMFPGMCDARSWIRVAATQLLSNQYYGGSNPDGTTNTGLPDLTPLLPNAIAYGPGGEYSSDNYYAGP